MKKLTDDHPVFELKDYGERYDLMHELHDKNTDNQGREYEMITQCIENTDFYQGLNMITVK